MPFILPCLLFLAGCASLPSRPVQAPRFTAGSDGVYLATVPPVKQSAYQCGPAALESVLRHWGEPADAEGIAQSISSKGKRGVLNIALAQHMRKKGFWTQMQSSDTERLKGWVRRGVPPIVMLKVGPMLHHFAVVTGFREHPPVFYLNAGRASVEEIGAAQFDARWSRSGRWTLLVCPADKVDWPLSGRQTAELALLHEKRGDLEKAFRLYGAAAQKEPDNQSILFNLANIHLKAGRFREAAGLYERLAPNNPGWAELRNNLAWARLSQGDGHGAIRELRAGFRNGILPAYDSLDTLGLAYCRTGRCRRARACFAEALAKAPPRPEVRRQISLHLEQCAPAHTGK